MQQTDVRQKHRLMPPPIRGGSIIIIITINIIIIIIITITISANITALY